jgi:hypothetical protein
VLVAGTAVLYGSVGTDLFLIGLDPATGAERWRRQVSVTAFSPDQQIRSPRSTIWSRTCGRTRMC